MREKASEPFSSDVCATNSDDLSNSKLFFALDTSPGGSREPKLSSRLLNTPFICTSDGTPPQHVIGKQRFSASQRSHIRHLAHATVLNPVRTRRVFEHWARLMRRHNNRAAQLAIHTKQRVQEILLRNRIKLRRGLVEQQHARAQRQNGRQATATVCDRPKACQYRGEANLPAQRNSWSQLRDGASHHALAPSFPGQTPSRATRFRTRSGSRDPGTHSPRAPPMPAHPCRRRSRPARAVSPVRSPAGAISGLSSDSNVDLPDPVPPTSSANAPWGTRPVESLEHRSIRIGVGKAQAPHLNRRHIRAVCRARHRSPIQPSHQPNLFSSIACNTQGSIIQAAYTT